MEPLQAVVLGAIQGLTEFFPVSSSGHLVIFQQLMGLKEPVLLFDISVHVGTLAAIFCYYFKDILRLAAAFFQVLPWGEPKSGRPVSPETLAESRMAWLIVAGSVPTALIGSMLNTVSDVLFSSLALVGLALVVTGAIVLVTRGAPPGSGGESAVSLKKALWIGTVQGLAVIPGISRSGSTIAASLFLGIDRDTAARFSFLLSVPAILGALVLEISGGSGSSGNVSAGVVALGTVTAFVVGYAALSLLVKLVQKGRLYVFAPYCFLLGIIALMAGGGGAAF
jgi:undecaprenyl-diphosphatase